MRIQFGKTVKENRCTDETGKRVIYFNAPSKLDAFIENRYKERPDLIRNKKGLAFGGITTWKCGLYIDEADRYYKLMNH